MPANSAVSFRPRKPPTRRQLAASFSQAVPVLQVHSKTLDYLKAQIERVDTDVQAFQGKSLIDRWRWLLLGR